MENAKMILWEEKELKKSKWIKLKTKTKYWKNKIIYTLNAEIIDMILENYRLLGLKALEWWN